MGWQIPQNCLQDMEDCLHSGANATLEPPKVERLIWFGVKKKTKTNHKPKQLIKYFWQNLKRITERMKNQWVHGFGALVLKVSGHWSRWDSALNAREGLETSFEIGSRRSVSTALSTTGAGLPIMQHHQKRLEFLCQCTAGSCQQGQPMPKSVHSAWT